jgi:hypothetical protein
MSDPVARLVEEAVDHRSRETLVEAFVAAARFGESVELPFQAAEQLGLEPRTLLDEAADHLAPDEEELLRRYADDR